MTPAEIEREVYRLEEARRPLVSRVTEIDATISRLTDFHLNRERLPVAAYKSERARLGQEKTAICLKIRDIKHRLTELKTEQRRRGQATREAKRQAVVAPPESLDAMVEAAFKSASQTLYLLGQLRARLKHVDIAADVEAEDLRTWLHRGDGALLQDVGTLQPPPKRARNGTA